MPLITFTRGSLRASLKVARRLSGELGCTVISREEVIDHAIAHGMDATGMATTGFMESQPPHFWDGHAGQRRQYLIFLKASLMDYMVKGNIIYLGHLGQFILSDVPKLLRVRVDASLDFRVRALMQESELSEAEAEEHIKRIDSKRRSWAKFLYGADFDSPINYDMILNMEHMSLDSLAEVIASAVKYPEWQLDEDTMKTIRDVHLASTVLARLAASPRTRGMELEAKCDSKTGKTKVSGQSTLVGTETWEHDIKAVALEVDGVSSVDVEDLR